MLVLGQADACWPGVMAGALSILVGLHGGFFFSEVVFLWRHLKTC